MSGDSPRTARTGAQRALIVGAGLAGRWHADAARRAGAEIAGFLDSDPARAATLASRFDAPEHSGPVEEVLRQTTPDVVHVCTPTEAHEEIVRAALEAGCDVLCEKPLAADAATTARLYDVARRQGGRLCPVHQYAFQRGVRSAETWIETAGSPLHFDAVACSAGAEGKSIAAADWLAGEILSHPLSLIDTLLPDAPDPAAWHARRGAPGEWRVMGSAGSVGIGILVSAAGRPTRNTVRLICEEGTIHLDLFHGYAIQERGAVSRARKAARPFVFGSRHVVAAAGNLLRRSLEREVAFPGLQALVSAFYDSIATGSDAPLSERHAIDVARGRDALLRLCTTEA